MGRGRARNPGQGKHRKGRMPKGTKPRPSHWKMKRQAELQRVADTMTLAARNESAALKVANATFKMAAELPAGQFDGDMMKVVDQVMVELTITGDLTRDRARAIVREQLAAMKEQTQQALEEAKRGDE